MKAHLILNSPYSLIHTASLVGCFCLGRIGLDLLLFNDYPSEIASLEEVWVGREGKVCLFVAGPHID